MNPCEADRIGLVLQGKQHDLAPEGCQDRAAPEPTRLLEPDQQLSDLGGKETASLCSHHSQLYMLACQGRKCSVVSCYAAVKGAHNGAPFCKRHLTEASRRPSPKGSRTPVKRQGEGSLSSALRVASSSRPVVSATPDPVGTVNIESAPTTPVRRRATTPPPSGAKVEPDIPGEVSSMEGMVLVRIRPFFGRGVVRPWYIYKRFCRRPASDGRRNERVRIEVPSLSLVLSIPWASVGATPQVSQHRLPSGWLKQYLNTSPDDLQAAGVSVQAVHIPDSHSKWLDDWDGVAANTSRGPVLPPLRGDSLKRLITQPELCLLSHDEGRLLLPGKEDFATPPRPTSREDGGPAHEEGPLRVVPDDSVPSDLELWAQCEEEKARSGDPASAIALLATAHEQEPDVVRAAIMRCLERDTPFQPLVLNLDFHLAPLSRACFVSHSGKCSGQGCLARPARRAPLSRRT